MGGRDVGKWSVAPPAGRAAGSQNETWRLNETRRPHAWRAPACSRLKQEPHIAIATFCRT